MRLALSGLLAVGAVVISSCGQEVSSEPRPAAAETPTCEAGVVFVLDVSLSMEATDVAPTRLAAAKQAAKEFADRLPKQTPLGLVTFAGTAMVGTQPSTDRAEFKEALDAVTLSERTATGEGIFTALASARTLPDGQRRIILLSDGKQTVPFELNEPRGAYTAAEEAQQKNVPISTISLGTDHGEVTVPGASRVKVPTHPESLREIARLSGGDFHNATSPEELSAAFDAMTCG
ncbi:VWA domain-containing protein [Nocardia cyriacigeorgica]|uniref:VWA domain-containing protein n=2 Tax=Nocardia cyriacigeorgica TaxID=135487 RepID=A0A6P1DAP0_9NOCA|nr:VWA domain-containing protein [Nocardia cyriacigeorgica]NEW45930.1 VWA domain-containing protein [Nocardia cyriacigeorgica]NEW55701.1 VWA domain-containing protein [Nocardia cyriacigeorgica]